MGKLWLGLGLQFLGGGDPLFSRELWEKVVPRAEVIQSRM